VWHLVHADEGEGVLARVLGSLRQVANYWRLEKLGAQVSPYAYLAACLVSLKRRPLPRLLATLYGWLVKL